MQRGHSCKNDETYDRNNVSHVVAGQLTAPGCRWQYAPPEAVLATHAGTSIHMRPSFDIWALGVIAFEVITQSRPAIESSDHALACARGQRRYPWHDAATTQPCLWHRSKIAPLLLPCLAADPAQRPRASAVQAAVSNLLNHEGEAKH